MKIDFDAPFDRQGTGALKWDWRGSLGGNPDSIPLWVADMDLPCPAEVADAIRERARHLAFGYTWAPREHFASMQRWLLRQFGWEPELSCCIHSPSVVTSLMACVTGLTEPGDGVLIMPPVYGPFFAAVKNHGRRLIECPLKQTTPSRYTMDIDLLDRLCASENVRMILFCNPHNPVGRVWTEFELEAFAAVAHKHQVIVVSDEIHADLVFEPHCHRPLAMVAPQLAERLITAVSPSKTFNLAGLQASALICSQAKLRAGVVRQMQDWGVGSPSLFGLVGFRAAYEEGWEWYRELRSYLRGNRDLLLGGLRDLGFSVPEVEGTYLAWLDATHLQRKGDVLLEFFAKEAGVALELGSKFGADWDCFVRLNFACQRTSLARAIDGIDKAVRSLANASKGPK